MIIFFLKLKNIKPLQPKFNKNISKPIFVKQQQILSIKHCKNIPKKIVIGKVIVDNFKIDLKKMPVDKKNQHITIHVKSISIMT